MVQTSRRTVVALWSLQLVAQHADYQDMEDGIQGVIVVLGRWVAHRGVHLTQTLAPTPDCHHGATLRWAVPYACRLG